MSTTTDAQRGDHRHPEAAGAARTSTFGHGAAARLIRRTSVIALAGTLALASDPTSALAAQSQQVPQASASQGAGQPGEPPSGDAPSGVPSNGASPSGSANTMSFDYSSTYSGAITADGTQVSSDGVASPSTQARRTRTPLWPRTAARSRLRAPRSRSPATTRMATTATSTA